ncbi:MAG: hypothetical protein LKG11_04220 [Bacilli bacterium]|jgi:uncharacterized membrane protein|nr:hypothetical protein [Bacilli bacterium]
MTRKKVAVLALAVFAAGILTVALSFVPVYTFYDAATDLTYYDSMDAVIGSQVYLFVAFEALFGVAGLASVLPLTRKVSVKVLFAVLIALLFLIVFLYVYSYRAGKAIFEADPTKSPCGIALFL